MDGYVAASKAKKEHADLVALAKKLDGSDFREKAGKMSLSECNHSQLPLLLGQVDGNSAAWGCEQEGIYVAHLRV